MASTAQGNSAAASGGLFQAGRAAARLLPVLSLTLALSGLCSPPAFSQQDGGFGHDEILRKLFDAMKDEPSPEPGRITRGMDVQQRRITELHNKLLGNPPPALGAAGLLLTYAFWLQEQALLNREIARDFKNFEFEAGLREQLPRGGAAGEVIILMNKNTGLYSAAFDSQYWRAGNRDVIRGAYPVDRYDSVFRTLRPLPAEGSSFATEWGRAVAGRIIDSRTALQQHLQERSKSPAERIRKPTLTRIEEIRISGDKLKRDLADLRAMSANLGTRQGGSRSEIGGVALGGTLEFAGGAPDLVYVADGRVYARVAGADMHIAGVEPADLATILRGIELSGTAPAVSIGTEPSDRAGYQKVTYFGGIRHTRVGDAMFRADERLKSPMAGIGAGPGGRRLATLQEFLWTCPDTSGGYMRMWLTSPAIRMRPQAGQLVAEEFSLRLHYETGLRDGSMRDPELDQFVAGFNVRWKQLALEIPEFERLERLAVTAALALWISKSGTPIAPELWLLPVDRVETPSHVPGIVTVAGGGMPATGGVVLVGEDLTNRVSLGVLLPFIVGHAVLGESPSYRTRAALMIGFGAAIAFLVLPFCVVLLANRGSGAQSQRPRFATALRIVLQFLLVLLLVQAGAALLMWSVLGPFDAEFLSFLIAFIAPGALLGWLLWRRGYLHRAPLIARVAIAVLGVSATLALASMSAGINRVLIQDELLSPSGVWAANALGIPVEIAGRSWASQSARGQLGVRLFPQSIVRSAMYRFHVPDAEGRVDLRAFLRQSAGSILDGREPTYDFLLPHDGSMGPPGVVPLKMIRSPGFASKSPGFSLDGRAPY